MTPTFTYNDALTLALRGHSLNVVDARLLLQHVTGASAAQIIAYPGREVGAIDQMRFESLVERRAGGEPIAYLVGYREFYSRSFRVNRNVLIPRPETEGLIDAALTRLPFDGAPEIVDLGTGSGCVGITLALEQPNARVLAIDTSADAIEVARANALALDCRNIDFVIGDWLAGIDGRRLALIVANPPYIAADDMHLEQGDLRFEPKLALTPGADGLAAIRTIIAQAPSALADSGWLILEHGFDQGALVRELLSADGFTDTFTERDLAGHERTTGARWMRRRLTRR
ncbi:MAG: peptide chain release factor N(5)-glutamine methyltransferase [Proteobacteria bacterium]|nr:peptide chain release factor N(5)-glutamine methyltransferase [Burkholderiales bacterium]